MVAEQSRWGAPEIERGMVVDGREPVRLSDLILTGDDADEEPESQSDDES